MRYFATRVICFLTEGNAAMQVSHGPTILNLAECLRDYDTRFPKTDEETRALLGEFTGGSVSSNRRWLSEGLVPVGEKKWRAIVFFTLLGYSVSEFTSTRPLYQQALELFALDVVSIELLATEGFGFQGEVPSDRVYRVFTHNSGTSAAKEEHLKQFLGNFLPFLKDAKLRFAERYKTIMVKTPDQVGEIRMSPGVPTRLMAMTEGMTDPARPVKLPPIEQGKLKLSRDTLLASASNLIQGLLPLVELIASDAFSVADRAKLREMTGGDGVFRLSNKLEQLCGERARNQITKQGTTR